MRNKIILITFFIAVVSTYWVGNISINIYLSIISTFVAIYIVFDNRNTSKTLVWVMLLSVNPVLGLVVYYLFGGSYGKKKQYELKHIHDTNLIIKRKIQNMEKKNHSLLQKLEQEHPALMKLLENTSTNRLSMDTSTKLYHHGVEKFDALFDCIDQAKHHIHLQYYILSDDHLGEKLIQKLARKAESGVQVRLIYDNVGSIELKQTYLKRLNGMGIDVAVFGKVRFRMFNNRINYRNHRKIAIIDGNVGFVGGMNVGNNYIDPSWRDTHMKIEGEAVKDLQTLFCNDWMYLCQEDLSDEMYFPKQQGQQGILGAVKIVASGPDQEVETIKAVMFSMINDAKQSIQIATPYFVPDDDILSALKIASLSGVTVSLLMPSIADRAISFYASRSFYKELMKSGIHIYTYDPGFVHSKLLIIDEKIATMGTCNMDMRSFHLNFEVNAVLFENESVKDLVYHFKKDLEQSSRVQPDEFEERPRKHRIAEALSRLAAPML